MTEQIEFSVHPASWEDDNAQLKFIREEVFVREQKIPEHLEFDDQDPQCYHVLALDNEDRAVGTGRLTVDGHIGRMAVLPAWRGHGIGVAILQALMDVARDRGFGVVALSAQTHAAPFYEAHGFLAEGPEHYDAGIPHRWMTRPLD